jgi:uncharacterized protein (UPF0332 family)
MTGDQAKTKVINYWRVQAREALESARSELAAERLGFAMNRAYYACFYIVSAFLLEENKKFVKHSGVRSALHRYLVKTGRLNAAWGKIYDRLFAGRQEADYQELVFLDRNDVTEAIHQAEEFVTEIEKHIS